MTKSDCVFCKIITGTIPATILTQNDHILVIKDIHPKAPHHYLLIPKKHIVDFQDLQSDDKDIMAQLMMEVRTVADLLNVKAFNLVVNNGLAAGQQVFHLHVHFLAGKKIIEGL